MYEIESTSFGYKLTFSGRMDKTELEEWRKESKETVQNTVGSFGVLVNMRDLGTLADDAQEVMVKTQHDYREWGMERSAVIVDSATTKLQFQRLAKESGIDEWERYIDTESFDDPEEAAMAWIQDGVEPEEGAVPA
jgi:hypothetical protein